MHRRRNKVEGLFLSEGSWCTDANIIQMEPVYYFQNLFASNEDVRPNYIVTDMENNIMVDCAASLTREVTKNEVWESS